MKVVIGKRDGLVIVSGGGSLEEQKNNLKDWEVLDTESGALAEQNKYRSNKIRIEPEDLYIAGDVGQGGSIIDPGVVDATAFLEKEDFTTLSMYDKTLKKMRKTSLVVPSKADVDVFFSGVESGKIFTPVLEEGQYKFIIPYSKLGEITDNGFFKLYFLIGNNLQYANYVTGEGYIARNNYFELVKKYGLPEYHSKNAYINPVMEDGDVTGAVGICSVLRTMTENDGIVPNYAYEDVIEGYSSNFRKSESMIGFAKVGFYNEGGTVQQGLVVGKDLIPDIRTPLGAAIELPLIPIEFIDADNNPPEED